MLPASVPGELVDPPQALRRRRRRLWIVLFLILGALLAGLGCCAGFAVWASYQLGIYPSSNKIRITTPARDAFLKFAETEPDAVLYVKEYDAFAYQVSMRRKFVPEDTSVISVVERDVPVMIDSGSFRPFADDFGLTITHDGGPDVSSGYEVVFKGPVAYYQ